MQLSCAKVSIASTAGGKTCFIEVRSSNYQAESQGRGHRTFR